MTIPFCRATTGIQRIFKVQQVSAFRCRLPYSGSYKERLDVPEHKRPIVFGLKASPNSLYKAACAQGSDCRPWDDRGYSSFLRRAARYPPNRQPAGLHRIPFPKYMSGFYDIPCFGQSARRLRIKSCTHFGNHPCRASSPRRSARRPDTGIPDGRQSPRHASAPPRQ